MKLVRLKNVEPGMITAKEVLDHSGNVLMKAGMELSERAIEILNRRSIESFWVESEGDEEDTQDIERMKLEMSEALDAMFEDRLEDEVMAYIHKTAKAYLTQKLES